MRDQIKCLRGSDVGSGVEFGAGVPQPGLAALSTAVAEIVSGFCSLGCDCANRYGGQQRIAGHARAPKSRSRHHIHASGQGIPSM